MSCFDRKSRGNKLIMQCLQSLLWIIMKMVNRTLAFIRKIFF
jgi:hypothetical protein